MVLVESFKIIAGTVLFARSSVKAIQEYLKDEKKLTDSDPPETVPKGTNLDKLIPEKLPTAIDIKKIIPRHCFDPKVKTSMYYAIKDIILVMLTFGLILVIHQLSPPVPVWYLCIFMYWCIQGTLFTAFFVIGHDCGHSSFSHHNLLNDVVGTIFHGFLLCPYFMWKLTHKVHHKNNANLDKDEVFYPVHKSEVVSEYVLPGFGFGFGWFMYLLKGYSPRDVPHFAINHPLFRGHRVGFICSLLAVLAMASVVFHFTMLYGVIMVINLYFVPLFIFASYTVIITFLHHSEVNITWYADSEWDFVRGQLSTIDRNYGFVHHIIHSIGTHQVHHMFTKVPHYHLEEATIHFRKHFPELVRICDEPILPSFMRMFRKYSTQCIIEDDTKRHTYH